LCVQKIVHHRILPQVIVIRAVMINCELSSRLFSFHSASPRFRNRGKSMTTKPAAQAEKSFHQRFRCNKARTLQVLCIVNKCLVYTHKPKGESSILTEYQDCSIRPQNSNATQVNCAGFFSLFSHLCLLAQ
jgi:hypothetical protein